MADMEYENENDRASPQDANRAARNRSASPNGRAERNEGADTRMKNTEEEEGAQNTGTNLFVTGIHPRLSEADVIRLFEKYGEVENCSIMLDPHTKESRGFGFVNMVTPDQAEAAREGLQGEVIDGRTLSIEKARRSRPRTPTPGKYFGPPKREEIRGPSRGGRFDRYDDRRVTAAVVVIIAMITATEASIATLHQAVTIDTEETVATVETAVIEATEVTEPTEVTVQIVVTAEVTEVTAVVEVEDIMTEMMLAHNLLRLTQMPLPIVSLMSLLAVELMITVGTIDPAPAR
ncbi:RNA recognition domain-containing protein family protein [Arthroderma uncinatum]|uniref:RNA recognition domain-containing protein family protein n=1 Tax=Arthroderma uncinatum TaxID=74035 RepID=UPI00144AA526|nr:RNA recognition domain-containing protein family protein [Arthroderma uncinatum]KAF3484053.1 RNA recognition domain-containing protein family protein [Arthroderma uncinatum]